MSVSTPTIDNDILDNAAFVQRELKVSDRCDGCGAQAFAVATKSSDVLLFCGHHLRKSREKLMANGWWIQDDSFKLVVNHTENVVQ